MRMGLGLDLTSAEAAPSGDEPPTLTFSTGLTRVSNTITANLSTGIAGSQSVVGGTAASETLTLSSTAHATKGKILFGTSAYDEVNNRLGIGTASPATRVETRTDALGTTQDTTAGFAVTNETAAASGLQQISPAMRWKGYGWKTTATAASQAVEFRAYVLPVQGSTAPSGNWVLQSAINGGAYADVFTVSSAGTFTTTANINAGADLRAAAGNSIYWNGRSTMTSPSDGVLRITNAAATDFGRLQFGGTTSSFPSLKRSTTSLIVRLADDSADAPILASTVKATAVAGYISSDGSTGATGTITAASTVTVKDGIITLIV